MADVTVSSGVEFILGILRQYINDEKIKTVHVVDEVTAEYTTGVFPETYYTDHLPIASGYDTQLKLDRWVYTEADSEENASGLRCYVFNVESGSFYLPSGAIITTSGGEAKLSYSYEEMQKAQFTDNTLKLFIQDAVVGINNMYDFGHTTSGVGSTLEITPAPLSTELASYLYAKYASLLIRKRLEAEGMNNRIYIRDLTVTVDMTKGMGDLIKSSDALMKEIQDIIKTLRVSGQEAAFGRINMYSTYVDEDSANISDAEYETNERKETEYFGR